MESYQKASQAIRQGEEKPINLLKNIGLTAGAAGIATAGSKLIPAIGALTNKYVPDNLMVSGLEKVNPGFKSFINSSLSSGYSHEDIREFLNEKIEKTQEPAQESKSIIEKYSPELFNFIKEQVGKGRNPLEAGAIAQNNDKFKSVIKKLENDHKTNWSNILQSVFGGGQSAQPEEQQSPQGQQQAQGGIDPNLQAIGQKLQQLLQSRGM